MTGKEAYALAETLKLMYDIVRFVDVSNLEVCTFDEDGNMTTEPKKCSSVWEKDGRCENCISSKVCAYGIRAEKFEFAGRNVHHVTSQRVEINGKYYALEGATSVHEDTMFTSIDRDHFIKAITDNNKKLYIDPLTGAYNRRHFDEQLSQLGSESALAIIDVDNFKDINDSYGHISGDTVLKEIVNAVKSKVRPIDAVIRYGGDEFLIVFHKISSEIFIKKLEEIREAVEALSFQSEAGDFKVTVSIGGKSGSSINTDLLNAADKLLYKAKLQKNTVSAG